MSQFQHISASYSTLRQWRITYHLCRQEPRQVHVPVVQKVQKTVKVPQVQYEDPRCLWGALTPFGIMTRMTCKYILVP